MPSPFVSRLKASVHDGIRRSTVIQEGGAQDSIEILIGKGKVRLGIYRLFHSVRESSFSDIRVLPRPATVLLTSRLDSLLVNRRSSISVLGTLSRTLSVPSVSGPSLQVCGYHIDRALAESDTFEDRAMECCPPAQRGVFSECQLKNVNSKGGFIPISGHNHGISYGISSQSYRTASMCLKRPDQPNNSSIYGFYAFSAARRYFDLSPYLWMGYGDFHSSFHVCSSVGPAHDVTYSNSAGEGQMDGCSISSEGKTSACKGLKLLSSSCYLPHPDKEETGGEDAHFIWDELAIGVADGVGGWADMGVDAGQYSRELMSNSVSAIQEEPKESIDPARVLEKAHSCTKAKGSSTACIVALRDQQGLHAINLGDSGFMVVRDGCTIFRSPVQQHGFNFTYQLESGEDGDPPSCGQVFTVPVAPGDVIIAGTDGLFDNLYNNEITAVVVHAVRAGFGPQVTAQKIAALARQRAQEKDRQTPFSAAAQEAGIRYHGGKLDDITVVVSYITSSNNENQSPSQAGTVV